MTNFKAHILFACIIASVFMMTGCDDDPVTPVDTSIAPDPPTSLTATSVNGTTIRLNWTRSTTAVDSLDSYILSITGMSDVTIDKNLAAYTIDNLIADSIYTFSLKAKGTNNKFSTAATIQAAPIETTLPPAAPTNLMANSDEGAVNIKWVASTSANSTDFSNYELTITPEGGTAIPAVSIPKTALKYTVTGLTNGTIYTFALRSKSTTASNNLSNAATVQWAPAKRMYNIKIYETASSNFGAGYNFASGEVLRVVDGSRWDIGLDTRSINGVTSYDLGSPGLTSYSFPNSNRTTLISQKRYENVASLDAVFDTEALGNTASAMAPDAQRLINFTNATSGFLFFAKTEEGNFAKILVKANNGKILQGTAPNRYVEMDISYQTVANVPYALKANPSSGKPAFKTMSNSPSKKGE